MKYPVIQIGQREQLEQLGTKYKFWFTDDQGAKQLCKIGRAETGENWSEKAAYELAKLFGIPCAEYNLAMFEGKQAITTKSFIAADASLVHGNELLARLGTAISQTRINVDYEHHYDKERRFELKQYKLHTVVRHVQLLEGFSKIPLGYAYPFDVTGITELFIAYLMFDAWIGNQDRHDENWGGVIAYGGVKPLLPVLYLAPSYDHASSLGCRLVDTERRLRLYTKDKGYNLGAYAAKAKTPFFAEDGTRLKTMDAFKSAMSIGKKESAMLKWFDRLEAITDDQVLSVFNRFPSGWLSDVTVEFTVKYLAENKKMLMSMRG